VWAAATVAFRLGTIPKNFPARLRVDTDAMTGAAAAGADGTIAAAANIAVAKIDHSVPVDRLHCIQRISRISRDVVEYDPDHSVRAFRHGGASSRAPSWPSTPNIQPSLIPANIAVRTS
jgi:hypothetical protein